MLVLFIYKKMFSVYIKIFLTVIVIPEKSIKCIFATKTFALFGMIHVLLYTDFMSFIYTMLRVYLSFHAISQTIVDIFLTVDNNDT